MVILLQPTCRPVMKAMDVIVQGWCSSFMGRAHKQLLVGAQDCSIHPKQTEPAALAAAGQQSLSAW